MDHATASLGAKPDIRSRDDIQLLVDDFYKRVLDDQLLGPVFLDVAKIDIEHHLPTMYSFWASLLLTEGSYHGAPFPKHFALQQHLSSAHFTRWLEIFNQTLDTHFSGEVTERARARAHSIADVFQAKMGMKPFRF